MTPSSTSHTPPKTTGAQRARKRLLEKLKAQPPMLPTRPSRQVLRAAARKARKQEIAAANKEAVRTRRTKGG